MRGFGGSGCPIVVQNGIGDVVDAIQNGFDFIRDFLNNTGKYCVKVLNGSLSIFQSFVNSAMDILTKDTDDPTFQDFWTVINSVSSVLCVIASTILVMLFLINMCTEAWDTRHDMDLFSVVKQLVKMIVSVVLVNNALRIVTAVFTMGARLAQLITFREFDDNLSVSGANSRMITYGVSGMNGLLMFIVYIIASLVVIATGIIITIEIYQRVFKMYVLIPFSTISFTTFVMGDGNRGNDVFHGYLKSILSTAIEAVVMMMCVSFCYTLINSGQTMNDLMNLGTVEYNITCQTTDDSLAVVTAGMGDYEKLYSDGISPNVVSKMEELLNSEDAIGRMLINGEENTIMKLFGIFNGSISMPCTITIYQECDWKAALLVALTVVFPCVLCAGAIKQAGQYSSMIFGR